MKKIIGYIPKVLLLGAFFFIVQSVQAQTQIVTCNGGNGIVTALGCIETTPQGFISRFFQISLGIAGGVAFVMILLGAMQVQISTGDPKKLQQGRELIEGAVIGLLMIILSFVILRIIGVNILALPGFS